MGLPRIGLATPYCLKFPMSESVVQDRTVALTPASDIRGYTSHIPQASRAITGLPWSHPIQIKATPFLVAMKLSPSELCSSVKTARFIWIFCLAIWRYSLPKKLSCQTAAASFTSSRRSSRLTHRHSTQSRNGGTQPQWLHLAFCNSSTERSTASKSLSSLNRSLLPFPASRQESTVVCS